MNLGTSRQDGTSPDRGYSLSIKEAAVCQWHAGHPLIFHSIQRYCAKSTSISRRIGEGGTVLSHLNLYRADFIFAGRVSSLVLNRRARSERDPRSRRGQHCCRGSMRMRCQLRRATHRSMHLPLFPDLTCPYCITAHEAGVKTPWITSCQIS
jgi:hypothetical protein